MTELNLTSTQSRPFLIRHLAGEKEGRFPVWLMRQAGRYLPAYQEIRKQHTFWEMVSDPEVATRVSLMPLDYLKVDAVIFFSDILTLPYGLGIPITMKESVGPVCDTPFREVRAFDVLKTFSPEKHTAFVGKALTMIRKQLPSEVTLIGFAGSPWTVGCYLVEGKGKTGFPTMIEWMEKDPKGLATALSTLGDATFDYLKYQIESGAHLLQLFDTWLGSMSISFYRDHYQAILEKLIFRLKKEGVPVTYFAKGAKAFLGEFRSLPADCLGVEPTLSLQEVEAATEAKFSLQGNLDPETLMTSVPEIRRKTRELVAQAMKLKKPPVINLGHGVLPKTPVENVQAFVNEARALWV